MTISGWIAFVVLAIVIISGGAVLFFLIVDTSKSAAVFTCIITIAIVVGLFGGMHWYYNNTASGQRELVDQKSNLNNGLERVITVYTADGKEMARYEGLIDISSADGYVKFDVDGKRYIYYNCFVESIANIED